MMLRGRSHRFGNDVNTDYIIASKYKSRVLDMGELVKHVMEDADPNFHSRVSPGDFIVAGSNFGCGSSRETAPRVIKAAGVSAVLAKGFARIFFRNAINVGLPVIECDTEGIEQGDSLEVDLAGGVVRNLTKGVEIAVVPLPGVMVELLNDGGLVEHFKRYGTFHLRSLDY
ncbi:MAG: 3-isopropylmalate dehydratase small subunit [Chloroflexota bacterium]